MSGVLAGFVSDTGLNSPFRSLDCFFDEKSRIRIQPLVLGSLHRAVQGIGSSDITRAIGMNVSATVEVGQNVAARNSLEIKGDERVDLELLLRDSIFVRLLVEVVSTEYRTRVSKYIRKKDGNGEGAFT